MKNLIVVLSLMVSMTLLSGFSLAAASIFQASAISPRQDASGGSGENVVRPTEVTIASTVTGHLNPGSGENVARPTDEMVAAPATAILNPGSGENVVRPTDELVAAPAIAILNPGSGENVARPLEDRISVLYGYIRVTR